MSDLYGDQTVLLLHCEGANGSTTFQDSAYRNIITANGDAKISTAQKKFGTSSAYFDGVGDYLALPTSSVNFAFGTNEFTMEAWVRPSAFPGGGVNNDMHIVGKVSTVACTLFLDNATGVPAFFWTNGNVYGNTPATLNQWNHVAVCRVGNTVTIYLNGVAVGSSAITQDFASGDAWSVGGGITATRFFNGHIDELRITKGVARYTADFTPPTAAFDDPTIFKADDSPLYWDETKLLMHMDGANGSTYFRDERHNVVSVFGDTKVSTSQAKFSASAAFDGTGDYLTVPLTNLQLGTGDFTIELWSYQVAHTATYPCLFSNYTGYANAGTLGLFAGHNGGNATKYNLAYNGVAFPVANSNSPVRYGVWEHIVLQRLSGVLYFFLNGVLDFSISAPAAINGFGSNFFIGVGGDVLGTSSTNGYIDEVRITKGVARYTDRFVPPTKAFPNLAQFDPYWNNVVLYAPFNGPNGSTTAESFADISPAHKASTLQGTNLAISTGSAKFNGSSVSMTSGGAQNSVYYSGFSTAANGDFTAELFFKINATDGTTRDFFNIADAASDTRIRAYKTNTNVCTVAFSGSPYNSPALAAGVWYHLAVSRSGGTIRAFLDGIAFAAHTFGAAYDFTRISVGSYGATGSMLGNISHLRVTNNVARYTANFTPPTEPFPTTVPQSLSGVVHDSNGNPVQRTARSYRRDTGQLIGTAVSDPITGLFSLPADNTDEHFVVVFDDTKNALVYDHIVPVI